MYRVAGEIENTVSFTGKTIVNYKARPVGCGKVGEFVGNGGRCCRSVTHVGLLMRLGSTDLTTCDVQFLLCMMINTKHRGLTQNGANV